MVSVKGSSSLRLVSPRGEMGSKSALVIIDMQNDFVLPSGSLYVSGAEKIIPIIQDLATKFDTIVVTQDWHPKQHVSFASRWPGKKQYEVIQTPLEYMQVLFPDHCVQDTPGAEVVEQLKPLQSKPGAINVKKGTNVNIDSYSCFYDVIKSSQTSLHSQLKSLGITRLVVVGVATDYCVAASALDAVDLGYDTTVVVDAIAAVNPADVDKKLRELRDKKIKMVAAASVGGGR